MPNYFSLLFFLFCTATLLAQPGTTSESGVQLQEVFIDGKREQLLGNYDKAVTKFKEVLDKDKTNGAAAYELARAYDALKKNDDAVGMAKKSVELEPGNEWFQMFLADLYARTGKDKDAASVYGFLVKKEPRKSEYYSKWAYFLVRAGQPAEAVKVYDSLEKLVGVNEETTRHKHTLYLGMGEYKKAGKELENLIAINPKNTSYKHMLATFYDQIREKEKAKEVYRQILNIDPKDARAKIALAEGAKGNDDIQFLNSLKPVFENPGTDIDTKIKEILPYVNNLSGSGDRNLGNTLLALSSILEQVHPNSAKAYSVLGDVLYHIGQPEQALEKYKKCIDLDDNIWLVWEQMLYIYAEKNDFNNLVTYAEKALDIFPNQATAHYLNGVGYNGKNQPKEALAALQQALIMSTKNPRLRFETLCESGNSYFNLKQYAQSDNSYEEALKLNPNDPLILRSYSNSLSARSENLEKAKELAIRLNELAPGYSLHEDAMGWVLYKMKDYKTAKAWLDNALQNGGDAKPLVLEHYGDVLFQLGNAAEAIQYWQKALDKGGKSAFLEQKVAEGRLIE